MESWWSLTSDLHWEPGSKPKPQRQMFGNYLCWYFTLLSYFCVSVITFCLHVFVVLLSFFFKLFFLVWIFVGFFLCSFCVTFSSSLSFFSLFVVLWCLFGFAYLRGILCLFFPMFSFWGTFLSVLIGCGEVWLTRRYIWHGLKHEQHTKYVLDLFMQNDTFPLQLSVRQFIARRAIPAPVTSENKSISQL